MKWRCTEVVFMNRYDDPLTAGIDCVSSETHDRNGKQRPTNTTVSLFSFTLLLIKPESKTHGSNYKYDLSPLVIFLLVQYENINHCWCSWALASFVTFLLQKLARTPQTPMWAERGESELARVESEFKKHSGFWPRVVRNAGSIFKIQTGVCMWLVCV